MTREQQLNEAFPQVDPGAKPFGDRVLVQLRSPRRVSYGGIVLPEEARDQDKWLTSVGVVIALGPLAFKDRNTLEPWPEGFWVGKGDYVRCPKHGGDRWEFPLNPDDPDSEVARFAIYRDRELIAQITGDPLAFRDYI